MLRVSQAQVFRQESVQGLTEHLLGKIAEHQLRRAVELHDCLGTIDGDDGVHCRINQTGETELGFVQCVLGTLALGDIEDDGQKEALSLVLNQLQMDFYRIEALICTSVDGMEDMFLNLTPEQRPDHVPERGGAILRLQVQWRHAAQLFKRIPRLR
jgi:hypothetical protein